MHFINQRCCYSFPCNKNERCSYPIWHPSFLSFAIIWDWRNFSLYKEWI